MTATAQTKKCPFCAESINTEAKKCKHCGEMLEKPSVLIEQTSKKYKMLMLVGGLAAAVGLVTVIFGGITGAASTNGILFGMMVLIGGIGVYAVARILAWWHHG